MRPVLGSMVRKNLRRDLAKLKSLLEETESGGQ